MSAPARSRVLNLADLFEVVADACPDRTALVAGDTRLTYRQLDERGNRFAHALVAAGLRPGDHVGVYARNRAEWLEAMVGAFKSRTVPVNINYRYVEDELRYIVDNADLKALVVEHTYLDKVAAVLPGAPLLGAVFVLDDESGEGAGELGSGAVGYEDALAAAGGGRDLPSPHGDRTPDDRYIVYTGGTTGFPKGVEWRGEDIYRSALSAGGPAVELPDDLAVVGDKDPTVHMLTTPLMHGNGQWVNWIALLAGGTAVLWTGLRYDAAEILRTVERERCVTLMLVGDAMARPLADELEKGGYDVASLRVIGSGGALLSPSVKDQLRRLVPGLMIGDSFGASEYGAGGSQTPSGHFTLKDDTKVLGDDLRPVAVGETGRLARTGHIPLGYYKDPAKTAATFAVDPDGTRWVVPGDFARLEADGGVTLLGRGSVCINTGGEKVFPEEVEAVLKAHPAVYDAVVVGVPDERFGESVAAVVSLREGAALELAEVAEFSRTRIAGYKVPRSLVVLDEVKRNPAGKADYRWAKEIATGAR